MKSADLQTEQLSESEADSDSQKFASRTFRAKTYLSPTLTFPHFSPGSTWSGFACEWEAMQRAGKKAGLK